MRGSFRRRLSRFSKRTWVLVALGFLGVLLLGGGAYAALGGAIRQQSSSDIELQRGLVGWWKLDGNAKDATPYSDSGTISGATATTDRKGKTSGALAFDGVTNAVSIPDANQLDSGSMTASLWVNVTSNIDCDANNNWRSLISKGSTASTTTGWDVVMEQDMSMQFDIGTGSSFRSGGINVGMQLNVPMLLTFTYDAATGTRTIYANGVQKYSSAITPAPISANTTQLGLSLGGNNVACPNGNGHVPGSYDDVRVYNRAVTAAEAKALYDQYDPGVQAASGEKGLMGWWKLDGNAKDATPNANNGTVNGPTLTTDRKGRANSAYNFAGSGTNNISLGNSTAFNSSEVTMSAWIHPTALTGTPEIIAKESQYKYRVNSSGQVCVLVSGNGSTWSYNGCLTSTGVIVAGNWYHVAVTISSSGNSVTVYVNGVQAGTAALGTTITAFNGNTMYLGAYNSGGAEPFIGDIDDARFYKRVLSATEISNMYNSYDSQLNIGASPTNTTSGGNINAGLVGYWAFNGNAKDATPYSNNATVNGATLTTDRKGLANSAYNFDGTSNYISIPNQSSLGTSNQPYSITGWFNSNATGGNIAWMSAQAGGGGWCLAAVTLVGSKLTANSWDGALKTATGATTVTTGSWYQFASTWDATNGLRVYLNGNLDGSIAQTTYSASGTANYLSPGFHPASCSTGNAGWFNGSIDELRVYNRALSATEVQTLYNSLN